MCKLLIIVAFICLAGCGKSDSEEIEKRYSLTGIVLDYDLKLPIAGAKVYRQNSPFSIVNPIYDSAISDASGKVVFSSIIPPSPSVLIPTMPGMMLPHISNPVMPIWTDRIDTVYLGRPSYVSLHLHRINSYQSSDIISIMVRHNLHQGGAFGGSIYSGLAISPDTTLRVQTFFMNPPNGTRLGIEWEIVRSSGIRNIYNGSINKIQYGTQDYFLNY